MWKELEPMSMAARRSRAGTAARPGVTPEMGNVRGWTRTAGALMGAIVEDGSGTGRARRTFVTRLSWHGLARLWQDSRLAFPSPAGGLIPSDRAQSLAPGAPRSAHRPDRAHREPQPPQPRALLAGVQRPGAAGGGGPGQSPAGAAQVHRHLRFQPRRVLHEAGGGLEAAARQQRP